MRTVFLSIFCKYFESGRRHYLLRYLCVYILLILYILHIYILHTTYIHVYICLCSFAEFSEKHEVKSLPSECCNHFLLFFVVVFVVVVFCCCFVVLKCLLHPCQSACVTHCSLKFPMLSWRQLLSFVPWSSEHSVVSCPLLERQPFSLFCVYCFSTWHVCKSYRAQ